MFRNDPDLGALPVVGNGSVDIAYRTTCGQAVRYGGDIDALIAFLGDDMLVNFNDAMYRKQTDGSLTPMPKLVTDTIIVKPPAGDWFVLSEAQLNTEYAIVVNVPKMAAPQVGGGGGAGQPVAKAPVKKAATKNPAPRKK